MKSNGKNKNLIRIVAMTSMTVFSLMAVFTGTLAWFNANRVVNQSGDEMQIAKINPVFKNITLHRFVTSSEDDPTTQGNDPVYYFDQATASSATLDQIENGTASISYVMDKYTLLRQTNPTLALIELNEAYDTSIEENSIRATLETTTTTFLTSYSAEQVSVMSLRPLSNIIKVHAGYLTANSSGDGSSSLNEIKRNGSMTYAIDGETTCNSQYAIPTPSSYMQFVTFENDEPSNLHSYLELLNANSGEIVQYIYIIFDYNAEALQLIYNHFLGQPFLEEDLAFQCDWTLVI